MSELTSTVTEWRMPPPCDRCGDPLSPIAMDHSAEGFGHDGVCCACYEQSMRGVQRRKRKTRHHA